MDIQQWWLPSLLTVAALLISLILTLYTRRKTTTISVSVPVSPAAADSNSPSSSSSSTPLPAGCKYEVFLSFRGPDTRKEFTDFLYTYLEEAGIRTFRDDEELRKGEEIGPELIKAITESKIAIPVLSKGYASSKWCLRELAKMVECKEKLGQKIFPVFYDVEPNDVRHQTGKSFEDAFRQHKHKNFDEKIVEEWKEALKHVGALKGWVLKNDADGHQGLLVKMVFQTVLMELKSNYMLMTDELVGIDHHIEEMMRLLNVDCNDVRIVGIHGMGGIGKTTIAKTIYNRLSEHFDHCSSFLEDVRETSQQHNGIVILQNQLISSILKKKSFDITSADDGINTIKDRLRRKKVFIVLDDVDHESHIYSVIGKPNWLASGSRILVTTRYKKVLQVLKVEGTYEPTEMKTDYALQLFCNHAFRMDSPPEEYKILSREIVTTAAGLPLALKIYGSLLFGERKAVWEETLMQLKELPNEEVQEKLKISYNALTYEQKQLFLDIACLFIGEDGDIASFMWNDCKFYPAIGINVLVLRSLVKIGEDNEFRMHDQLRDLGREIVRRENIEEPGRRSRLWNYKDADDVLFRRAGTEMVKAFSFRWETQQVPCLTSDDFTGLSNLRFLAVNSVDLTGDFKNLCINLRWLQWRNCPGNFAPTNFCVRNLVILDLSGSNISDDWEGWSQIKVASKLKVLDLSNCKRLSRTPDLSTFATLERLILVACRNMVLIDPSIRNAMKMRVLCLIYSSVKKLPDVIGELEQLEEIDASDCELEGEIPASIGRLSSLRILKLSSTTLSSLPMSISRLSCLQTLDLENCTELQWLPELPPSLVSLCVTCTFPNILNLVNLQKLHFFGCHKHVEIPEDIWKLSRLEMLYFYETNIVTLPGGLCSLSSLLEVSLQSCRSFVSLVGLPSSLLRLYLQSCESLETLPDLSNLKILSELRIGCPKLKEVQGLGKLESLVSLRIYKGVMLHNLDGIEHLVSLKSLCIEDCESLKRLPDLGNLKKLKRLDISHCQSLIEIQGLEKLGMLDVLLLSENHSLLKVEGLEALKSLTYLNLEDCTSIERLPDLSKLGMLKTLSLANCQSLDKIDGLGELKSCEHLDLSDMQSIVGLPDISKLGILEGLVLNDSQNLVEIPDLQALRSLKLLNVSGCISLESLPDLSNLRNLKELKVNDCVKLTEIPGLEELTSLELLEMNGCKLIEKLPNLSRMKHLEKLCMSGCENLVEICGFEGLKTLTLLDISGCKSLEIIPDLPNVEIVR